MRLLPALLTLWGLVVLATPVCAGTVRSTGAGAAASPQPTLDAMLARAEGRQLSDALRSLEPTARIAWLRRTVESGGSSVLVLPLVRTLVRKALLLAEEDETAAAAALLADATRFGLYGYIAMRIQAPLCSDMTSSDEYLHELGLELAPLLERLSQLDPVARRGITEGALALDEGIRPITLRDNLLCRRGRFADRFCPPGTPRDQCPENAAPWAEFVASEDLLGPRLRARKRAREEVVALGR
jgi:hypothetical protein